MLNQPAQCRLLRTSSQILPISHAPSVVRLSLWRLRQASQRRCINPLGPQPTRCYVSVGRRIATCFPLSLALNETGASAFLLTLPFFSFQTLWLCTSFRETTRFR